MFSSEPLHLTRAKELRQEPPQGSAFSVPLPGSEKPGRSRVYRAWNAQKSLVKTLDPQVGRCAALLFPKLPMLISSFLPYR